MALLCWLRELTLRDALVEHGGAVAGLADAEGLGPSWRHWQAAAGALLTGLYEAALAREALEGRYLSGRDSLFPATAESWQDAAERCEWLHGVAATLGEDGGVEPPARLLERAAPGADASAARMVRMASIVAHGAMGERDRADAAARALMEGVTMP